MKYNNYSTYGLVKQRTEELGYVGSQLNFFVGIEAEISSFVDICRGTRQ